MPEPSSPHSYRAVFVSPISTVDDATLIDAKKKLAKVRLAYDKLPKWVKRLKPIKTANTREFTLKNGSSIEAGVSHRGGTLQYLHISEFGKICARFPERAREIITGALNTLAAGQMVFIESTAEGESGRFFEICEEARSMLVRGAKLTSLDWKFFFYPWFLDESYALKDEEMLDLVIPDGLEKYFTKLQREHSIALNRNQKGWYAKKRAAQDDDMWREYPSTPDEAFRASVQGAIYGEHIRQIEEAGQVGHFPALPGIPVHTVWDIGRADATAIWFFQVLVGRVRIVGYYEEFGLQLYRHMPAIRQKYMEKGWVREGATDFWPHDGRVAEWTSTDNTRVESGVKEGLNIQIVPNVGLQDGINAGRSVLQHCDFDEAGCDAGLKRLRNYRWEWNEAKAEFNRGTPRPHDPANHGSDAFRYLALSWREILPSFEPQPDPVEALKELPTIDEAMDEALGEVDDDFYEYEEEY